MEENYEEYLRHFPSGVSKDIKDYAVNEAFDFSRYIFTHRQGEHQYGYCTHCHKEFETYGLKHNKKTQCPFCKSECIVKASGKGRSKMVDEVYFTYYEKSVIDPQTIIAMGIYAIRDYRGDYKDVKTNFEVNTFYIFKVGESAKIEKNYYWLYGERIEKRKNVTSNYNKGHFAHIKNCYCRESIKEAVKGTQFQYSTWENYDYNDMVEFFALYIKYPLIEYLSKLNFKDLVVSKLVGDNTYSAINWHGKTLFKVLRLTKQDLKEIKQKNIEVTFLFLKLLQLSRKEGSNLSLEDVKQLEKDVAEYYFQELQGVLKYTTMKKTFSFINKQFGRQKILNPNEKFSVFYDKNQVLVTWNDYIADCIKLQMNLDDEHVLFPKNLYRAHQNTIKAIKVKQDKELDAKIKNRFKSLEKYCFEYNGLFMRPAKSSLELIDEGKLLHHCVATYIQRYALGETNIMVIRKMADPQKPYFTLELRKNEIIQCYGNHDCTPRKDVIDFMDAFKEEKLRKKTEVRISIPA